MHRLLARDAEGRWRLGPALTELAGHVNDPLLAAGAAVLPRLREITGESVQLYRREGTQRVCIAALEPPAGLRDTVPVGTRLPMTAGSGAKVLLACSDAATQQAVLADGEVHRPDAGRGAQAGLGAERRRARAGRGERVGAGARRPRRGDRRGLGVRPDRPDGPQAGCALGGGPAGGRGSADPPVVTEESGDRAGRGLSGSGPKLFALDRHLADRVPCGGPDPPDGSDAFSTPLAKIRCRR